MMLLTTGEKNLEDGILLMKFTKPRASNRINQALVPPTYLICARKRRLASREYAFQGNGDEIRRRLTDDQTELRLTSLTSSGFKPFSPPSISLEETGPNAAGITRS